MVAVTELLFLSKSTKPFPAGFEMKLSVIIVNYNVKLFLEQCLYSVQKAIRDLAAEIIVIDNHSTDNSLAYLQPKFPQVHFITNGQNVGFGKACNQGFQIAKGEYILFLNPDTIVPEDCFHACINFLASKKDAGALGIKMLDGKGRFLKESKRSFPSPATSLYKLFGLAKLFPHHKKFSKYHLGYLDEDENNEVDVLAGAFMMVKKEVLDKVGCFDETFFMYGEDVDLSYRIQKAGYKNYYFAGSRIVHFKGESTRKGSMNYVRMFYQAMSLFVRKHYSGSKAGIYNFLIHVAIWFRASLSAIGTFVRRIGLPILDAGLILLAFWLMKNIWNNYIRPEVYYENKILWIVFPAYSVFYLLAAYYAGLYDRWYKRTELFRSTLVATIVLLAAYAMLPEQYRFSRAIILFGSVLAFLFLSVFRWLLIQLKVLQSKKDKYPQTVIVGTIQEFAETKTLLQDAGLKQKVLGRISLQDNEPEAIGFLKDIRLLSTSIPFREIIFCAGQLSYADIIQTMKIIPAAVSIKIHAWGTTSIVSSDSKDVSGEAVSKENGFKLSDPYNRRLKRLIDVSIAIVGLLTFPLHFFFVKKPFSFFGNCFQILLAQKTWIGYATPEKNLPSVRKAVIANNGIPAAWQQPLPEESLQMVDYWYARDYEPMDDVKLIWKMYRRLGE